jgi:hypothetical protein
MTPRPPQWGLFLASRIRSGSTKSVNRVPIATLPPGIYYHPSVNKPERLLSRIPDPSRKGRKIDLYRPLGQRPFQEVLDEMVEWRDTVGAQLWKTWPDVTGGRTTCIIEDLPVGVSVYITLVTPRKVTHRPYPSLRVYCYWQAYGEGRNKNGNYPQRNKKWTLPLHASRDAIMTKVAEAEAHLNKMRALHPKPPRSKFKHQPSNRGVKAMLALNRAQ